MATRLWGLAVGPAAQDYLDAMSAGKQRAQIVKKMKTLLRGPHPSGSKKLVSFEQDGEEVWRLRSGDYRILYVIRDRESVVIDIDHRKDVYR